MTLKVERAVGDTLTKLAATIQNDGTPRDLSGKTVTFVIKTLSGATIQAGGAVTVTSAANGEVEYDFQSSDVATAGTYKAWFIVQDGSSEPDTYPDNADGISLVVFDRSADTTPEDPSIDIIEMANAPTRTRTVEGTVEERSLTELIKADQYTQSKDNAGTVPWGIRLARTRPGGMTT